MSHPEAYQDDLVVDFLHNIKTPSEMDVLGGRGGAVLRHPGNKLFRELVERNKEMYTTCLRSEKSKISASIVNAIRSEGGRFLEKDAKTGLWNDIGDKAIEKTSQALREGQPKLAKKVRKQQESISSSASTAQEQEMKSSRSNVRQLMNSFGSAASSVASKMPIPTRFNRPLSLPSLSKTKRDKQMQSTHNWQQASASSSASAPPQTTTDFAHTPPDPLGHGTEEDQFTPLDPYNNENQTSQMDAGEIWNHVMGEDSDLQILHDLSMRSLLKGGDASLSSNKQLRPSSPQSNRGLFLDHHQVESSTMGSHNPGTLLMTEQQQHLVSSARKLDSLSEENRSLGSGNSSGSDKLTLGSQMSILSDFSMLSMNPSTTKIETFGSFDSKTDGVSFKPDPLVNSTVSQQQQQQQQQQCFRHAFARSKFRRRSRRSSSTKGSSSGKVSSQGTSSSVLPSVTSDLMSLGSISEQKSIGSSFNNNFHLVESNNTAMQILEIESDNNFSAMHMGTHWEV